MGNFSSTVLENNTIYLPFSLDSERQSMEASDRTLLVFSSSPSRVGELTRSGNNTINQGSSLARVREVACSPGAQLVNQA